MLPRKHEDKSEEKLLKKIRSLSHLNISHIGLWYSERIGENFTCQVM